MAAKKKKQKKKWLSGNSSIPLTLPYYIGQEIPGQARGWRTTNFVYSSMARASTDQHKEDDVPLASVISLRWILIINGVRYDASQDSVISRKKRNGRKSGCPEIPVYHSHSPIIGQEIPGQARGWRTSDLVYSSMARASTNPAQRGWCTSGFGYLPTDRVSTDYHKGDDVLQAAFIS
jgi:hypothetical protein